MKQRTQTQSLLQPGEHPLKDAALPAQVPQQLGDPGRLQGQGGAAWTFSRTEAARVVGVSVRTLDRLIDAGVLRYVPGTKRISKRQVESWVHDSTLGRTA